MKAAGLLLGAAAVIGAVIVMVGLRRTGGALEGAASKPRKGAGKIVPRMIVVHYTATQDAPGPIAYLQHGKASAHFVIDRDGKVTSIVPPDERAWHAGKSEWKGAGGVNGFSVGIELVNVGPLKLVDGTYRDHNGRPYSGPVVETKPRFGVKFWAEYPRAQLEALVDVILSLREKYPTISEVVGHEDVSPGRKWDPGPAFPWKEVRAAIGDNVNV